MVTDGSVTDRVTVDEAEGSVRVLSILLVRVGSVKEWVADCGLVADSEAVGRVCEYVDVWE